MRLAELERLGAASVAASAKRVEVHRSGPLTETSSCASRGLLARRSPPHCTMRKAALHPSATKIHWRLSLVPLTGLAGKSMSDLPACPECGSEYSYESGHLLACPDCGHEWSPSAEAAVSTDDGDVVKDAFGNVLESGDSVKLTKDLKVKGTSTTLTKGTKVKNIRVVESSDGHNIDCKVDGVGQMKLKSEFVKKS